MGFDISNGVVKLVADLLTHPRELIGTHPR
jgi:hypothetical protein